MFLVMFQQCLKKKIDSQRAPQILAHCLWQKIDVCWSIEFIQQFEANFKLKEDMNVDNIYVQELINVLPTQF